MLASSLMMPGRKDLLCAQGADGGRLRRPPYGGSLVEAASSGAPGKHYPTCQLGHGIPPAHVKALRKLCCKLVSTSPYLALGMAHGRHFLA
jgi:hypothetical protein